MGQVKWFYDVRAAEKKVQRWLRPSIKPVDYRAVAIFGYCCCCCRILRIHNASQMSYYNMNILFYTELVSMFKISVSFVNIQRFVLFLPLLLPIETTAWFIYKCKIWIITIITTAMAKPPLFRNFFPWEVFSFLVFRISFNES